MNQGLSNGTTLVVFGLSIRELDDFGISLSHQKTSKNPKVPTWKWSFFQKLDWSTRSGSGIQVFWWEIIHDYELILETSEIRATCVWWATASQRWGGWSKKHVFWVKSKENYEKLRKTSETKSLDQHRLADVWFSMFFQTLAEIEGRKCALLI